MTRLLDIREKLQETHAALASVERVAAQSPGDLSLDLTVASLRQRQADLESAFAEAADREFVDVCKYRLISEDQDSYSLSMLTSALGSFQELVTIVYDAIKTGPKIRTRVSADIVEQSTFDFAYSYPGSLGFVLTMPNERLLIGESDLDQAISTVFEMSKSSTTKEVAEFAGDVGVAAIRRLYKWSRCHSAYNVSADIQWDRKEETRAKVLIQPVEMAKLVTIIEQTGEESEEEISVTGELLGLDVGSRNNFRLVFPESEDMTGSISVNFDRSKHYEIHGHYVAIIMRHTKIHYSIEKEEEKLELLSLSSIDA